MAARSASRVGPGERDEEADLAEALLALRRASTSRLLPPHAQGVLSASASLLELFAPQPVLRLVEVVNK